MTITLECKDYEAAKALCEAIETHTEYSVSVLYPSNGFFVEITNKEES